MTYDATKEMIIWIMECTYAFVLHDEVSTDKWIHKTEIWASLDRLYDF